MKAVLQRVTRASVSVDGSVRGSCTKGFLILLGVAREDSERDADVFAAKIANLRVFEDENGKMNLSPLDIGAEMLVVSQFTLCADCSHGRRPSFTPAAPPEEARRLYLYFTEKLKQLGIKRVETGVFGADMQVELLNDGPVTILLDSAELK